MPRGACFESPHEPRLYGHGTRALIDGPGSRRLRVRADPHGRENVKTLITGGAGFIGSNLSHRLIREGHSVTVFDDLSRRGTDKNVAWLRAEHGLSLIHI